MAIELITFAKLSPILELTKAEVTYTDLQVVKDSVVSAFEDFTNRTFEQGAYSEQLFTGEFTKMIPLLAVPVVSITQVLIDGVASADYKIKNYGIELTTSIEYTQVDVSYTGGFTTVPTNIERAALLQTVYEYQNKNSIGQQTVSTDGGSVTTPELGLLTEVKDLLNSAIHPYPVL